jgi:hypothetical protein
MANMALLRAVYHALKNRDAQPDSRLRIAFDRWDRELGASKPAPAIYWEFIVDERNQLLKEYSPRQVEERLVEEIEFDLSTGKTTDRGLIRRAYLFESGPFAGQDQRAVIKQARWCPVTWCKFGVRIGPCGGHRGSR